MRLLIAILFLVVGCDEECFLHSDCDAGQICSFGGECQPGCAGDDCASSCDPSDPCCSPLSLTGDECGASPIVADGWEDAPGSGAAFVVNAIAIAGRDRGENIDGLCDENGCGDNTLWRLGELGNDQIRQGLLGGDSLMLIEVAGLVRDYRGWDRSVTVKIYVAGDADDPFYPANNFKVPPGQTTCCEFELRPESIEAGQAISRLPARIRDGRLETIERGSISMPLTLFQPLHPTARWARAGIAFALPLGLRELNVGLLTGALLASSSAEIENPYCRMLVSPRCPARLDDSTLFDLFSSMSIPLDIDLDGDGIECAFDSNGDGSIDCCCTRCNGGACTGSIIPPVEVAEPSSCVGNLADGHSIALTLTGVHATVIGIGL